MSRFPKTLTHPLPLFLLSHLTSTATGAYTLPSSPARYLGFILCLALSYLTFAHFHTHIHTTGWAGRCLAGAAFTSPLVLFDRLIARKWAYGRTFLGPKEASKDERAKQSRWAFGGEAAGSMRCVGSEEEVANVPHFDEQDPQFVPSRGVFLARHAGLVVMLYYLNSLVTDVQLETDQTVLADSHIPFFTRIGDVSREEVATKVRVSISYWVAQFCLLQLMFSLCAFVGVAFNPSELHLWRPQFGSIGEAYTMRNFWGKFWHQNIQLNLKGPADFLANTILHLPPGTLFTRYAKILFAFAVSGVMHVFADTGGAVTILESGALRFFCTQAFGILLEDGVQELYRRVSGKQEKESWGRKVVGYVWVIAFISWSSPCWVYPILRTMKREDLMLNLTAMRPLIENLW